MASVLTRIVQLAQDMPPGPASKDESRTVKLNGLVTSSYVASARLLFFSVAVCEECNSEETLLLHKLDITGAEPTPREECGGPCTHSPSNHPATTIEAIIKERDGYLTQQDMLQAAPYLVKGASVRVVGYLERTHGDIHLHDGTLAVCVHVQQLDVFGSSICRFPHVPVGQPRPHVGISMEPVPLKGSKPLLGRSKLSGNHSRSANENRASVLASFIVKTLGGPSVLAQGAGVIDVAGGAGGLTFELSFHHRIACTLVDPVAAKLTTKQQRAVHKRSKMHAMRACTADASTASAPMSCGNNSHKTNTDRINGSRSSELEAEPSAKPRFADTSAVLDLPPLFSQLQCRFEANRKGQLLPSNPMSERLESLVHDASVLVGLHPDEATDAIVDVALANKKPFFVVPCCVFPNTFTSRRTTSGAAVRSYEDLCNYLQAKDPRVQMTNLPFEGRNACMYWIPS
mmetsp:Transcript_21586/g.41226  ORF Transcript_21586/g.41226 Transcript_21586/m.41226 type:complete len:458 (+) Transcript_21586:59-1432(+)